MAKKPSFKEVADAAAGKVNQKWDVLAPEYLSDPKMVSEKRIHGPRVVPVDDPGFNDDLIRSGLYKNNHPHVPARPNNPGTGHAQSIRHPEIKAAKPGKGNHRPQLGG